MAGMLEVKSSEPVVEAAPTRRRVWWVVLLVSAVAIAGSTLVSMGFFHGPEANGASTPTAKVRPAPVRVAKASRGTLRLTAEHRGELVAEVAELASQVTGRVTEVRVDIGDTFKAGELLARIDSSQAQRQIAEARAQVTSAEARELRAAAELAQARVELERSQKLAAENLVSQQELQARRSAVAVAEAEQAAAKAQRGEALARVALLGQQAKETKLLAPFEGAVAERYLDVGSLVQPGSQVLRLVRSGPLRVQFRVPERDLAHIQQGLQFEVGTQATGAQRFRGTVKRISAEVSRLDRSVAVEGVLSDETGLLRPGMYAMVYLQLGELKDAVLVPSSAVIERETGEGTITGVYVVEVGNAHWKRLRVIDSAGGQSAVDTLEPGTTVITLGPDTLRDGAPVKVVSEQSQ